MEFPVAPLFRRTARRIALHDVNFAQRGVFFLAIRELTGQAHAVQNPFAACHFTRFAGGFAGAGGFDNFAADDFGIVRTLLQVIRQELAHDVFHGAAHFAGNQFVFGLAGKLRFRNFHRQHAAQAFAHIVTGNFDLGFFRQFVFVNVFVDDARHRCPQSG